MPLRPCLKCSELTSTGSYCAEHVPVRPSRQTAGRGGGWKSSQFRAAVLNRAAHQCEAVVGGLRCEALEGLQAHHLVPLVRGGTNDLANGVALCLRHHRQVTAAENKARAK